MHGHHRRDPATGILRCPAAFAASPSIIPNFTSADWNFVDSLSDEEIFLVDTPSCLDIPADVAPLWSAAIAPLMQACVNAPDDDPDTFDRALRRLVVVWTALCRPQGRIRSLSLAIRRRCTSLANGDALERTWRDVNPPRLGTRTTPVRDGIASSHPPRPPPSPDELRRRKAISYVYRGQPSKARSTLEATAKLGMVKVTDVTTRGTSGEAITAAPGTLAAEMLEKHPPPPPGSED